MLFVSLITFLSLLKYTHPHVEGFGRSRIEEVKTLDGKVKRKIIYSSIKEYMAMLVYESTKNSPDFTEEQVQIHITLIFGFVISTKTNF